MREGRRRTEHVEAKSVNIGTAGLDSTTCVGRSLYDKKSDEGSNSVRMRPENSGALKVVKK